jgi:uncharacterized protein GlcG (DUF336 family)
MRSWTRSLLAAILAGALLTAVPLVAVNADGASELEALLAQADARAARETRTQSKAPVSPGPKVETRAAKPAPAIDITPRTADTVMTIGGGLLIFVLAAIGLTITFRSLGADIRGRKHRYRRRIRREPRSA